MKYYVYHLIDPRDDSVFYVGKGTGKRCFQHKQDAIAHRNNNIQKENRIREIIKSGSDVIVEKVFFTDNEQQAYGREKHDIVEIGMCNLTNASGGKNDQNERAFETAKFHYDRMKNAYEAGAIRFNRQFVPMLLAEFKEVMDLCCKLTNKDLYANYA